MSTLIITLAGEKHDAVLPKRYAEKRELTGAWVNSKLRGSAALLGLCLPSLRIPVSYEVCECNAREYGAQVLELLVQRGIPDEEIVSAGTDLFNAIADGLFPSKEAVEKQVGFSSPSPDKQIT